MGDGEENDMSEKLKTIEGKATNWGGLWWQPDSMYFTSQTISLSELRKFKGYVRLVVRKNKFYNNGENGRPNYVFLFRDAKSENPFVLDVKDEAEENKERLYTYDECETILRKSWFYAQQGFPYGHFCVDDFV